MFESTLNRIKALAFIALCLLSIGGCSSSPMYGEYRGSSFSSTIGGKAQCNLFKIDGSNVDLMQGRVMSYSDTSSNRLSLLIEWADKPWYDDQPVENGLRRVIRTRFYKMDSKSGTQENTPARVSVYIKGTNTRYLDKDGNVPDYLSVEILNGLQTGWENLNIYIEDVGRADVIAVKYDSALDNSPLTYFIKPSYDPNPLAYPEGSPLRMIHPFSTRLQQGIDYATEANQFCFY